MALKSLFTRPHAIPNNSSRKSQPLTISFSGGVITMKPNDEMKLEELRLAQDARMERVGEYKTRRGCDLWTDAIGKATAINNIGADDENLALAEHTIIKQSFTPTSDFRLWQIDLVACQPAGATGVIVVDVYNSVNSIPSRRIATTTLNPTKLSPTPQTISAYFMEAPDLEEDQEYFLVIKTQRGTRGSFEVTAQDGNDVQISTDNGATWTNSPTSLNFTLYSAAKDGINGLFVAKVGATSTTFFGCGNVLYRADYAGVVTVQNDTLTGVTSFHFDQTTDANGNACVRYTYGGGKPRRIKLSDFSETEITAAQSNARDIHRHGAAAGGYLFYLSSADPNGVFSSEEVAGNPDNFDPEQSFVGNVPAPQCGDDLTAMASIAGALIFFTRRHKYSMLGESWQTFSVNDAASNNGTFSQRSIVTTGNVIYYASDTGIYAFNGSDEVDLTGSEKYPGIQNVYGAILNKESIILDFYDNRLYVFYSDSPEPINNKCLVYNTNLNVWESFDTDTYVSATCARNNPTNVFLQGHGRVGAVMIGESPSNLYDNLGAPIHFQLSEPYRSYGQPAQRKRISKWRPEFEEATKNYGVECGFSFDFDATVNYAFTINLSSGQIAWDSGYLWDSGEIWPVPGSRTTMSTRPTVYSEWRRAALHYRHFAAYEPVQFIGQTVSLQVQRIR